MLFEVKGWNLSAPLVTQTEDPLANKIDIGNDNDSRIGKGGGGRSSRRKRKRGFAGDEGGGLVADVVSTGAVAKAASAKVASAGLASASASASASDAALMSADKIGRLWERHVEKKDKNNKNNKRKKEKKNTGTGTNTDTIEKADRKITGKIGGKDDRKKRRRTDSGELEKDQDKKRVEVGRGVGILEDANGGSVQDHDMDKSGRNVKKKLASTGTKISKAERRKERKLLNANGRFTAPEEKEIVQGPVEEVMTTEATAASASAQPPQLEAKSSPKLTPLQNQMREKLISARFRRLNETLYTSPSIEAVKLFQTQPDLFHEYHAGFSRQVAAWPANPVDGFINAVLARGSIESADQKRRMQHKQNGKNKKRKKTRDERVLEIEGQEQDQKDLQPLPRTRGTCNIVDIGCGTAPFARALQPHTSRLRLSVRNFDLLADSSDSAGVGAGAAGAALPPPSVRIEQADMCALPVASGMIDVAILCLALMGTNWPEAIDEAWRVLRWKGELWIAETKSRFAHATTGGGDGIGRRKAGVVTNSDTKARRSKNGSKNKNKQFGVIANASDEDEDELDDNEKDEDFSSSISPSATTNMPENAHLIPFLTVLQKRGFVLVRNEPDSSKKNNHDTSDPITDTNTNIPLIPLTSSSPSKKSFPVLDTSNKMFVTMRLVKANMPVRGKNKQEQQHDLQKWRTDNGNNNNYNIYNKQGQKKGGGRGRGKWRTVVDDDDNSNDDGNDAKVLKACVYKLR